MTASLLEGATVMDSKYFPIGRLIAAFLFAGAGASACTQGASAPGAQSAAARGGQCFSASQVNSFHAVDDRTVEVTVGTRRMYELQIVGTCPEIDWTQRIALRSRSGSSWVCSGMDAEILVPSPSGLERCPVVGVRQLSPAEVEAARARRKR